MLWNSLGILHVFFGYRNLPLWKFHENLDSPTTGLRRRFAYCTWSFPFLPSLIADSFHSLECLTHILALWALWAPQEQRHPQRNVNALLCSTQGHFLWRRYGGVGSSTSPTSPLWPQNLQHQSWCDQQGQAIPAWCPQVWKERCLSVANLVNIYSIGQKSFNKSQQLSALHWRDIKLLIPADPFIFFSQLEVRIFLADQYGCVQRSLFPAELCHNFACSMSPHWKFRSWVSWLAPSDDGFSGQTWIHCIPLQRTALICRWAAAVESVALSRCSASWTWWGHFVLKSHGDMFMIPISWRHWQVLQFIQVGGINFLRHCELWLMLKG